MAKKIKPDDNQSLDAAEIKRLLDGALEEASKAAEHTSEQGNIVRQALDRFGLDRTAFTVTRRLYKMAGDRREATLRDMLNLFVALGFFDQRDAFDDPLERLVAKLNEGKGASAAFGDEGAVFEGVSQGDGDAPFAAEGEGAVASLEEGRRKRGRPARAFN